MARSEMLQELYDAFVVKVNEYRAAVDGKNIDTITKAEREMTDARDEYNTQSRKEHYSACLGKDQTETVKNALINHRYPVIAYKILKEDKKITGCEIVEDRTKIIDLVQFFNYHDYNPLWRYKSDKAGKLLALRAAKELGRDAEYIARLEREYDIPDLAEREDLGKTPDSTTKTRDMLQKVVDGIIFVDNGKGDSKNLLLVRKADVNYLTMVFARDAKDVVGIDVRRPENLRTLIVKVLHQIITGEDYDIVYKARNASGSTESKQNDAPAVPDPNDAKPKKTAAKKPAPKKDEAKTTIVPRNPAPASEESEPAATSENA